MLRTWKLRSLTFTPAMRSMLLKTASTGPSPTAASSICRPPRCCRQTAALGAEPVPEVAWMLTSSQRPPGPPLSPSMSVSRSPSKISFLRSASVLKWPKTASSSASSSW